MLEILGISMTVAVAITCLVLVVLAGREFGRIGE